MIEKEFDPTTLTNEELNLLVKNLQNEKKRRDKERKHDVALNLRNALKDFLDSEAECDYSIVYGIAGEDLLGFDITSDYEYEGSHDINYVEFDPFDTSILREIMNELSRCLDK
jgi:mRNA-degrading endonuclease YafQ of YafQ-DinJ toxin-antitoxin module